MEKQVIFVQTFSIDSESENLKVNCPKAFQATPLESLKQKLEKETNTSDLWHLRQKVQHFEATLRSVELFYTSTYKQLSLLEEKLLSHSNQEN